MSNNPLNSNSPIDLEMKSINENLIYLINDTSMVQSQIYFNINGNVTNEKLRTQAKAYNKYFSGGMSSIVFQEIREFRSLAYSSWASYSMPFYNGNKGMFVGYIGCQTDKTLEAISVFKDITINMPKKTERLEQVKSSLIKSINTDRPSFRRYPRMISRWEKMGYNDDPRKEQVNYFKTMSFDEIINFQKNNIANKPMIISVLTDQNRINIDELIKYGKIIILEKKDVLN